MRLVTKDQFIKDFLRNYSQGTIPVEVENRVSQILREVKARGDRAVIEFTRKFDHLRLKQKDLQVKPEELDQAEKVVPKSFLMALDRMIRNVKRYQRDLLFKDWIKSYPNAGGARGRVRLGSLARPLERVGVYVPGGTAPLASTVVMTVVPAKVAGVREIIATTPPQHGGTISPYILAACKRTGVNQIFRCGGAQAIGALAFGTETLPKVEKIVGPGNIYVTSAKRQVYGYVGIDMVAGPSEVLIIADNLADPKLIAADLLAQAEHDSLARTFLVTPSKTLAQAVLKEIEIQIRNLKRRSTVDQSMKKGGFLIVTPNLDEAIEIANRVSPEHLEILCQRPTQVVKKIQSAGAIFVGASTPEPVGDYVAGPSHVLPTGGTARFFSPLSARDFLKSMSYLEYDRESLRQELEVIRTVANVEGLDAHRRSAEARFS